MTDQSKSARLEHPTGQAAGYDYIICGGGCAGLSLVVHLIHSGQFRDKRILIIEQDSKDQNDRTWCFWESGEGLFEEIVHKQWASLQFFGEGFSKTLDIQPYRYKLIRGLDFYNYCLELIEGQSNVHWLNAKISAITNEEKGAAVLTESADRFFGTYVFNSILLKPPVLKRGTIWMLQHFKGWYVKTESDAFDPSVGTLMDFRTGQTEGATFFYVLPFSKREALVEYTLFSPKLLPEAVYEAKLEEYISQQLGITGYTIAEKEFGVIPMTNHSFQHKQPHVAQIGTAGGFTKGSSGYTFQFIQKSSAAIVESLIGKGHPFSATKSASRFSFYDAVLLQVLQDRVLEGADIFTTLFKKNKPSSVLRFLDNETSLAKELGIISSLPTVPFAKAAMKQLL